jgi:hypothetical protein
MLSVRRLRAYLLLNTCIIQELRSSPANKPFCPVYVLGASRPYRHWKHRAIEYLVRSVTGLQAARAKALAFGSVLTFVVVVG